MQRIPLRFVQQQSQVGVGWVGWELKCVLSRQEGSLWSHFWRLRGGWSTDLSQDFQGTGACQVSLELDLFILGN